jgi:hypothetical protein
MAMMTSMSVDRRFGSIRQTPGTVLRQLKQLAGFLLVLVCTFSSWSVRAVDPERCRICGKSFGATQYSTTDKVTREKLLICYQCAVCPNECYICGLPVVANPVKLPDGRFLCARDAKTAVMDERKAREICEELKDKLDRLFSRFLTLPSTNVSVALVDRVDLYNELAVTGGSFECPDILGYIHSRTNQSGLTHSISMMSALPQTEFRAAYAHEYAHAWIFENVASARRKTLARDATEGFCELLAYLAMDSLHEEEQKAKMLRNSYTRGQIDLFIAAEKKYGLNDILDWMCWGVNGRLKAADLGDVRNVEMPRTETKPATSALFDGATNQAPAPSMLLLKGISSGKNQPLALINNRSLAAGESARVRVGVTNILVRCLAIGTRSARVQIVDSGEVLELHLATGK